MDRARLRQYLESMTNPDDADDILQYIPIKKPTQDVMDGMAAVGLVANIAQIHHACTPIAGKGMAMNLKELSHYLLPLEGVIRTHLEGMRKEKGKGSVSGLNVMQIVAQTLIGLMLQDVANEAGDDDEALELVDGMHELIGETLESAYKQVVAGIEAARSDRKKH